MTLEEKIGQLALVQGAGGHVPDHLRQALREGRVGSVLNEVQVDAVNELQRIAVTGEPARHSAADRARCDPRIHHGLPHSAGAGCLLESGARRARRAGRRARGGRVRGELDLRADDRHRA